MWAPACQDPKIQVNLWPAQQGEQYSGLQIDIMKTKRDHKATLSLSLHAVFQSGMFGALTCAKEQSGIVAHNVSGL